ncbi:MAG TPA: hypothetical protein VKC60_06980 [Opitutaceae bacterium]|nr:hypothetical protein [Opitutaceae bacterium]
MLKGHCGNPNVVNIDAKIAQVPLSFYATIRWRMCPPNTFHDVGISVPSRRLYGANKIEGIVFDEPPTPGASLRVCGVRYTKSPFDFG